MFGRNGMVGGDSYIRKWYVAFVVVVVVVAAVSHCDDGNGD